MNFNEINISTDDLLNKYLYNKCIIVDIRTPLEYANYHIPNSINIPFEYLIQKPYLYLNKYITYYIICNTGNRSSRLTSELLKQNFMTINVMGGISKWSGPLQKFR